MKIDITTKNITLDGPLEVFINEKIGTLKRYSGKIGDTATAYVEIGKPSKHHKKGLVFYAEANMNVNGTSVRAQAWHNDLRAAIVDVKDGLKIELAKLKEKKKDSARKPRV